MTLKIFIADDHEVVRVGFREWLANSQFELVGEASTGIGAMELAEQAYWDVALIDSSLPDVDAVYVIERLQAIHPQGRAVYFAEHENPRLEAKLSSFGVGWLAKNCTRDSLLAALTHAAATEFKKIRNYASSQPGTSSGAQLAACLSKRELEVLIKLADGSTNKQIAHMLGISYETVKEHVQHVLHKIGVIDRTQAAIWALRHDVCS